MRSQRIRSWLRSNAYQHCPVFVSTGRISFFLHIPLSASDDVPSPRGNAGRGTGRGVRSVEPPPHEPPIEQGASSPQPSPPQVCGGEGVERSCPKSEMRPWVRQSLFLTFFEYCAGLTLAAQYSWASLTIFISSSKDDGLIM